MPVVATAAWSIPRTVADRFPEQGSGLSRYASVFNGVEVNSTFYRRHKPSTFAGWKDAVPEDFRFAVKIPREITHVRAMKAIREPFETFLQDIAPLAGKRDVLLCQLPPSLAFDRQTIEGAFGAMRDADSGRIVIEPRHPSWASDEATALLGKYAIHRVLADPPRVWTRADFPGQARYMRLHGAPKVYYSSYTQAQIAEFAEYLAPDGWCVFDNTASGAAIENALTMRGTMRLLAGSVA